MSGDLYCDWLYVSILWLAEPVRGLGLGSRLLATAKAVARAASGRGAHLDTSDFQARSVYGRKGCVVHGELGPYGAPPGHIRCYLKKSLLEGRP